MCELTLTEATKLLQTAPEEWKKVWDEAVDLLETGEFAEKHQEDAGAPLAVEAANMVRLLRPMTGRCISDCLGDDCEHCVHYGEKPHGRDVLTLYDRAGKLAMGDAWLDWLTEDGHFMTTVWGDKGSDKLRARWFPEVHIYRDALPKCGVVCPPLPLLRLDPKERSR